MNDIVGEMMQTAINNAVDLEKRQQLLQKAVAEAETEARKTWAAFLETNDQFSDAADVKLRDIAVEADRRISERFPHPYRISVTNKPFDEAYGLRVEAVATLAL